MKITKAQLSDASALQPLWNDNQVFHNKIDPAMYAPLTLKLEREIGRVVRSLIKAKGMQFLLAKEGEEIMGYIVFAKKKEESFDLIDKWYGYVSELFVDLKFRKNGVGGALMDEAEKYFQKQRLAVVRIGVSTSNAKTEQFYRRRGYGEWGLSLYKKLK
jgi:ribosomal protein S18 acetylase RimI-like enzyme